MNNRDCVIEQKGAPPFGGALASTCSEARKLSLNKLVLLIPSAMRILIGGRRQ